MTTTHSYVDTSREFLAHAREYLDEGDLLQASEKGWGAAAQMVKAAADARGWRHRTHRDLYAVVDRLIEETGDPGLRAGFRMANDLHMNFYEGWLGRVAVAEDLAGVAEFVEKLDALEA